MADLTSLSCRPGRQDSEQILSYSGSSVVDSDDEQAETSDTATIFSAATATTAVTASTASTESTAATVGPCEDRSLPIRWEMTKPSESSTVDYDSRSEIREPDLQLLWSNVMDRGVGSRFTTYTDVDVLLLCWAEWCDDLSTMEEVSRLRATFEERFNFHAQIKYLDTAHQNKLQVQVNTIVASFIGAHDGPSTLLIVYYAGHARPGAFYGSLVLYGQPSTTTDGKIRQDSLVWNKTRRLFEDAEADVLEIFDCCYAGNLALTREKQGTHRLAEHLAATQAMGTTQIPGSDSFTEALVWALEALVTEKVSGCFTTGELVKKITHAPHFPSGQTPLLSTRNVDSSAGRIMLRPLQNANSVTSRDSADSPGAGSWVDLARQPVLTLHFDLDGKPTARNMEFLGNALNDMIRRNGLGINRIRWGGIRQSSLAHATSVFQAMLRRQRHARIEPDLKLQSRSPTISSGFGTPTFETGAHSRSISPSSFTSCSITGSQSSTGLQRSQQGSSASLRESSSTTSPSVIDSWKESKQSKHELQCEKPLTVRETLVKAILNNVFFTEISEQDFLHVVHRCSWEVLDVLQGDYEPHQSLSGIITLTGTLENAQAATCNEYITQTWPNVGPFLLQAISDALKEAQETPLENDLPARKLAQESVTGFKEIELSVEKAPLTSGKTVRPMTLRVQGSMKVQAEVAEILAWLTAAIRISESTELKLSRARVVFTQYSKDTQRLEFWIEPETLEDCQCKADFCWQPLFVNSVIAVQFPVRERFQGVGVDISPVLMATLAGTVTAVEFRGGLILKGLQTALIPVRRLKGEQAIQWHLEVTDSTEGIIQTKGLEASKTENGEFEMYRVDNVETFWKNRAYLGWCSIIRILLGTKEIDYKCVTWSDPARHQKTMDLNSFTAGFASAGAGIGGPSVSATFTVGKRNRPVFMKIEQALEDRLKLSIVKPLLSYDTFSKRAWMVPTTCMLLHMMHLRVRTLDECVGPSRRESVADMPFASIAQDGGLEAYDILVKYLRTEKVSTLGSSETWKKTLAEFYVGLDMVLNESTVAKEKAAFGSSSELCGFELMDVVRAESPFKFTMRKIQRESGGWTTAAKHLGYALFCSKLGDAIVPGKGANLLCRNWQHVPHNSDYLCAYVPCVAQILAHQGKHTSHQRLIANEFRQLHYKHCRHEERSRCFHLQTFDNVSDPPLLQIRGGPNSANASAYDIGMLSEGNGGALIFGKTTKMTKAFPREDPPDDGEERRHRLGGLLSLNNIA